MQILRAADEPDRGHAIAMAVHRRLGRNSQTRIIGQPQIIVGTKVQHPPPTNRDMGALRPLDQPLALHKPFGLDPGKGVFQMGQKAGICHGGISSGLADVSRSSAVWSR